MKINNLTENQNFRWNKTTHLEMTMLALKDSELDNITKRQIARYVQMPDFIKTELGFYNNSHFYFPNSKKKSFGVNSGKYNAYSQFIEHLSHSISAKEDGEFYKFLGFALHYLQEMSNPLHTEPSNIVSKMLKYKTHKKFECDSKVGATSNLDVLKDNYKHEDVTYGSLLDLFKDTAEFSQNPKYKVRCTNVDKWLDIQKECFNRGVNSSKVFIERLLSVRKISTSDS